MTALNSHRKRIKRGNVDSFRATLLRGNEKEAASIWRPRSGTFGNSKNFYRRLVIARIEGWAIGSGWQGTASHFDPEAGGPASCYVRSPTNVPWDWANSAWLQTLGSFATNRGEQLYQAWRKGDATSFR